MTQKRWFIFATVVVTGLALAAWPVYAHCGKCVGSAKQMVKMMDAGKLNLAKAIEVAEKHCKGKAVAAYCELEGESLEFEVFCLVEDKIKEVEIDGKTGKVTEVEEHKGLPEVHREGEHGVKAVFHSVDEHGRVNFGESESVTLGGIRMRSPKETGEPTLLGVINKIVKYSGRKITVQIDGKTQTAVVYYSQRVYHMDKFGINDFIGWRKYANVTINELLNCI